MKRSRRLMQRPSLGYLSDIGLVQPRDLTPDALNDAGVRERLRGALLRRVWPSRDVSRRRRLHGLQPGGAMCRCRRRAGSATWRTPAPKPPTSSWSLRAPRSRRRRRAPPTSALRLSARRVCSTRSPPTWSDRPRTSSLQFSAIIGEEMSELRRALQAVVDAHAAKERDVLIATLEAGRRPAHVDLEGVALRRALAAEFKDCFDRRGSARTRAAGQGCAGAGEAHELDRAGDGDAGRAREALAAHSAAVDGGAQPVRRLGHRGFVVVVAVERTHVRGRLRRADREPDQNGVPAGRRRTCRHRRARVDAPTR